MTICDKDGTRHNQTQMIINLVETITTTLIDKMTIFINVKITGLRNE